MKSLRRDESGMALITVFLVLMLASALMVGFFAAISADQRSNGVDRDQTQAYAAAHAGLEKLTSDMAALFMTDYSPSATQINNLMNYAPSIPGFQYIAPGGAVGSGYSVTFTPDPCPSCPNHGNPIPDSAAGTTITSGPYKDFKGIITRYPITITARSTGGAEVRLRREVQTVAVPVFQFGVFSETDLSMWAGDDFNFGGRVQTNGNLFLAESTAGTLTLGDRVTAYKEVVRKYLSNGKDASAVGFGGTVNVMDTTAGHVRALALTEGSITSMPPTITPNLGPPTWTSISTGTYKSLLRNGLTGAKYLALPLVSAGAQPIDLIKRPVAGEDSSAPLVLPQRYYSMASMRILLSDTAAEITGLPGMSAGAPVDLGVAIPTGYTAVSTSHPPFPTSPGAVTMTTTSSSTTSQVNISAALPAYFKIPATIKVGTTAGVNQSIVCTGRTPTTFTGCSGFNGAIAANAVLTVLGDVASGAGTVTVSTSTVSGQAAIASGGTNKTLTVSNTAAFAPTVFWLTGGTGEPFNCTGYDTSFHLTGCTNLSAAPASGVTVSTGALEAAGTPLNRGFIKIEMQTNTSTPVWQDITAEILNLGVAGPANVAAAACDPTPNAVLRLYHVRDNPGGVCIANGNSSINSNDYWPNVLYDTREGTQRPSDAPATTDPTYHNLQLGGIMNYVSLDVGNLKRWLAGTIGTSGTNVLNQNGFIVYFSDRRGNKNTAATPVETGEYGFEDVVNPSISTDLGNSQAPSGGTTPDAGEDLNAYVPVAPATYTPVLDIYGETPRNPIASGSQLDSAKKPWNTTVNQWVGMVNRPIFFRRALKLVNGGNPNSTTSNIPAPGLTVAAENPVYVQGNYNATSTLASTETHQACAILGDAVTILSSQWNDANSFQFPMDSISRDAITTGYRFAVVAGKSLSFTYPTAGTPQFLFGTDGGVANFLHYLEGWGSETIRYRGSIVSLFISRQAVGTYKYGTSVYQYSARDYNFETEFLLPALLPPGTPMFRDINTLTFRQLLRPNQ